MIVLGADTMATIESQKRMERRRRQRWWERLNADPEIQALRRQITREFAARRRYQQRHPFSGRHPGLLWMHCIAAGIQQGGRPPKTRRCTKRLGTRLCWNWRAPETDRCYRHSCQAEEEP
jgi:hypothetical protein